MADVLPTLVPRQWVGGEVKGILYLRYFLMLAHWNDVQWIWLQMYLQTLEAIYKASKMFDCGLNYQVQWEPAGSAN